MNTNTKQSTKEKYQMILDRFVSKDDVICFKRKPFNIADKTFATTGHELIAVPKLEGYWQAPTEVINDVTKVYSVKENTDWLIYIKALRRAVESVPKIKEPRLITVECDFCDGLGIIDIDISHNGKDYTADSGCPVCDETGYSSIEEDEEKEEEKYNLKFIFKIGNSYFYMERVLRLLFVAETLNTDIRLVYQNEEHLHSMFKVGEADVILMPILRSRDGGEIIEIEFKKQ